MSEKLIAEMKYVAHLRSCRIDFAFSAFNEARCKIDEG